MIISTDIPTYPIPMIYVISVMYGMFSLQLKVASSIIWTEFFGFFFMHDYIALLAIVMACVGGISV